MLDSFSDQTPMTACGFHYICSWHWEKCQQISSCRSNDLWLLTWSYRIKSRLHRVQIQQVASCTQQYTILNFCNSETTLCIVQYQCMECETSLSSLSLDYTAYVHYTIHRSCLPIFRIAIIRSLAFLVLDELEENANISVTIQISQTAYSL